MTHVRELFDLSGRVAIVTGGSRGLGREMSEALAEAGASVTIVARRAEWLEPTHREFCDRGLAVEAQACDITDPQQTESVVQATLERFGRVDILVNNAGVSWGAPFEEMPVDRWRQVLETNVIGTSLMTRAVLPAMKSRQYGKIVNIASVAGLVGVPARILEASAYTASKGALIALTRELAANYAEHGIRVNAIAPGFFPTRMSQAVIARAEAEIKALIPLGRLGQENDLKGVALFLASPASDYLTGQIIAVDGGLTAV
jgi:NAD(P)-dependent dehydrogenase (short-subunit alcohol dehydrogenase family)